jgi:alkanesulfonate monooxygenase SsuD/methylene tetrahydromethanopterin reductase-like flavin-dependent oxidoreductase (luciferase family)
MVRYAVGLPTVGEFGDPRELVRLAVAAEEHGWDGVFVWDHLLYHDPDWMVANPVVTVSAIAERTARVRLGVLMTALPRRRVQVVARETATLDVLSGGRLVFGAALGSIDAEYAAFGEDASLPARAARLDASLDLLCALWSGEPVELPGGYRVTMRPPPVQRPRVPVWCAGRWPARAGLRRAARWDGAMPTFAGYGRSGPAVPVALFADAVGFLADRRGRLDGFDVALEGWTEPAGAAATVAAYAEHGLTWWVEAMGWWRGGLAAARRRVLAGPPG